MKGTLSIIALLIALVGLPISMYIQHSVLVSIHADRLLFFLFWINIPISILLTVISKIIDNLKESK